MKTPRLCLFLLTFGLIACGGRDGKENTSDVEPLKVVLEVDQMQGTARLQTDQVIDGQTVSLAGLYQPADIDLEVRFDQTDIAPSPDVSLGQLHGLMVANRNLEVPTDALHLYLLVVTQDHDDEDTLGIMFDFGDQDENDIPREAFAIFERAHEGLGGGVTAEMLLTAAHEIAHCFNLHHPDWEGSLFQRDSTIEGYSLTDSVRWQLSQSSIGHLRRHNRRLVLPGAANLPFGLVSQPHLDLHQQIPDEQFQIADAARAARLRRGSPAVRDSAVRAPRAARKGTLLAPDEDPLRLTLTTHKPVFQLGEPIRLTVELHNVAAEAVETTPLLDPEYGFLQLAFRNVDADGDWHPFRPISKRDGRGRKPLRLEPGDAVYGEAAIFYGSDGWTFEESGRYEVVADFPRDAESGQRIQSSPLEIRIAGPETDEEVTAVRLLSARRGGLGKQQGLYLLFQGGDHLSEGAAAVKELSTSAAQTPQASAANLALAKNALEPTLQVQKRRPASGKTEEAMGFLQAVNQAQVAPDDLAHVQVAIAAELEKQGRDAEAARYRRAAEETEAKVRPKASGPVQLDRSVDDAVRRHKMETETEGRTDDGDANENDADEGGE